MNRNKRFGGQKTPTLRLTFLRSILLPAHDVAAYKGKNKPAFEVSGSMETAGLSTTRIAAFSDSVFAFAATLLVLNIKVPELLPAQLTELPRQVFQLWPQLLSYIMSFVIVGIYWVAHHVMFHHIKRSDRLMLWLNITFLMWLIVTCLALAENNHI
jgi:hypothetical protein